MPSFTKSVSVALLVIASGNVLAAPFKENTVVDHHADPCLIQTGRNREYISLLGVCTKIVGSGKFPEGCSEDQARRCAAKETPADKVRAEERCPQIKDCPSDIVSEVWASCLLRPVRAQSDSDEGISLGMGKGANSLVSNIVPGLTSVSSDADLNQGKQRGGEDGGRTGVKIPSEETHIGFPGDADGHAEVDTPGQTKKASDSGKGKLADGVELPLGQGNKGPSDTSVRLPLDTPKNKSNAHNDGNDDKLDVDANTHGTKDSLHSTTGITGIPLDAGKKAKETEADIGLGKDGECSCAPKTSGLNVDIKEKASRLG